MIPYSRLRMPLIAINAALWPHLMFILSICRVVSSSPTDAALFGASVGGCALVLTGILEFALKDLWPQLQKPSSDKLIIAGTCLGLFATIALWLV